MVCSGCGNESAAFTRGRFFKNEFGARDYVEYCDSCGDAGPVYFPDVFWDGKPEENLADGPDGKPPVFISKGHKARYLQERGIYEAGDSFHGAPFTMVRPEDRGQKTRAWRENVREARRKVESMGRDARRQALFKVIKEARAHAEKGGRHA